MRDARVGVLGGGQLGRMMALAAVCYILPWHICALCLLSPFRHSPKHPFRKAYGTIHSEC